MNIVFSDEDCGITVIVHKKADGYWASVRGKPGPDHDCGPIKEKDVAIGIARETLILRAERRRKVLDS